LNSEGIIKKLKISVIGGQEEDAELGNVRDSKELSQMKIEDTRKPFCLFSPDIT